MWYYLFQVENVNVKSNHHVNKGFLFDRSVDAFISGQAKVLNSPLNKSSTIRSGRNAEASIDFYTHNTHVHLGKPKNIETDTFHDLYKSQDSLNSSLPNFHDSVIQISEIPAYKARKDSEENVDDSTKM